MEKQVPQAVSEQLMSELAVQSLSSLISKELVYFAYSLHTCTIQREKQFIVLSNLDACRELCNQDIIVKARRIVVELVIGQVDAGDSGRGSRDHATTVLLYCVGTADGRTCCRVEKKVYPVEKRACGVIRNGSSLSSDV